MEQDKTNTMLTVYYAEIAFSKACLQRQQIKTQLLVWI